MGHAEAALGRAVAPVLADAFELLARRVREFRDRGELRAVAVARHPVDRLAHALARATGEIHHAGREHRLVAEVELAHAGAPRGFRERAARADRAEREA